MEKGRLERHSEEILRGGGMKERCIRCGKETEYLAMAHDEATDQHKQ